jgi:predicted Fe-Mo cluster-binding NifX family protein
MGMHAQQLFRQFGIEVVLGAPAGDPACIVRVWLDGTLESGANPCDH